MRKKLTPVALAAAFLLCAVPVHAAEMARTERQAVERILELDEIGTPNWFGGVYYSGRYEDLKRAFGEDEALLYQHCQSFGFREGRIVLPVLDVVKYRAYYPDLEQAFGDDWNAYIRHYFEFGIKEGRKNFTDFDAEAYLELNPDLKNICGTSRIAATVHYLEHGFLEGRNYIRAEESKTEEKKTKEANWYYESDDSDERESLGSSGDSGNSGDSENSGSELFSGEKTGFSEDGSYEILTYVDGRLTKGKVYNPNDELTEETEYDGDKDYPLRATFYYENGEKMDAVYEYDVDRNQIKWIEKSYDKNGVELKIWEKNSEYVDGKIKRQTIVTDYNFEDDRDKEEMVYDYNAAEELIKTIEYAYKDGKIVFKCETLYDGKDEDGNDKRIKETRYDYNQDGELIYYSVREFENGKESKTTIISITDSMIMMFELFIDEDGNLIEQKVYTITASPSNATSTEETSTAASRAAAKPETASPSDARRMTERNAAAG